MKRKQAVTIESTGAVEVIQSAKKSITEVTLFYGLLIQNIYHEQLKKREIKATIDGSIRRLIELGISNEEIQKVDWTPDPSSQIRYKEWCIQEKLDFSQYTVLRQYMTRF